MKRWPPGLAGPLPVPAPWTPVLLWDPGQALPHSLHLETCTSFPASAIWRSFKHKPTEHQTVTLLISGKDPTSGAGMNIPPLRFHFKGIWALGELSVSAQAERGRLPRPRQTRSHQRKAVARREGSEVDQQDETSINTAD